MTKTITIVGGNLYRVAAHHLNDATQWIRIAQLNRITDPMLIGTNIIIIPAVDPSQTGGVPQ